MRDRRRRSRRPAPPPVQILLDRADDLHVLRALEAFVAARRGAILVRPTPGCYGQRYLCPAILEGAGLAPTFRTGSRVGTIHEQTVGRLQRLPQHRRVWELYILRAHTVGCGWRYLAELAGEIGARLTLVVHAPQPHPGDMALLRWAGIRVTVPRVLYLTNDRGALEVGLTPMEGLLMGPSTPAFWLPSVPVWGWPLAGADGGRRRHQGQPRTVSTCPCTCPFPLTVPARSYRQFPAPSQLSPRFPTTTDSSARAVPASAVRPEG
jgi:hypothetical protein